MEWSLWPPSRVLLTGYGFDGYELDVGAGELRKHGVRLRLRGQPLQVLEILLERSGEVVTRAEFQTRIWTADTFVDFDHSLHNAIARIREVLGDSAETPRYIETLPRRGYRYIGPVQDFQRLPVAPETGDTVGHTTQPAGPHYTPKLDEASGSCPFDMLFLRWDSLPSQPGGTSTRKRPFHRYVPLLSFPLRISLAIRPRNSSRMASRTN